MLRIRQKKILVIGAGAIGGIIAGYLARSGYNVQLVTRYNDLADRISTVGISISGVKGTFKFPIPSVAKVTDAEGPFDYIFVATKANDLEKPTKEAIALLGKNGKIVSIQNGMVEEKIASLVGADRVIGCVVGWGATYHKPGFIEMTSTGEFTIGAVNGAANESVYDLQSILNRFLKTIVVDNIYAHLYSKLIINMCITTLGAISGLTVGEMLFKRKFRILFLKVIKEAVEVANAMHLEVPYYAGKLNYYELTKGVGYFGTIRKHVYMMLFGRKYRHLVSSSLQSLRRGKLSEIQCMNVYISKKGKEFNIPTPLNDMLIFTMHQIENEELKISALNFNTPKYRSFVR